ncbi:MAG: recombinase family protein [Candidatus Nezhaarchaeota archaeon]|nr:recombinase family protein [Candidatus Nezhaarchaeota archaeon]MCX8141357.1 recombinase family protein [Candidatus Nezhaarchaeota archaeon]MDW8049623.1 recombinase family protein [Nitrososphaerota archaeon]
MSGHGFKAVAYSRTSTDMQTTEQQVNAIKEYAESRGIEIVAWFSDPDVSGATPAFEREGFKGLLDYAERNGVSTVIVYAIDRLGRSFTDIFKTLSELDRRGMMVISIRDNFLQTLDPNIRRLVLAVLAWASEYEVKLTRERVRLSMRRREVQEKLDKIRKIDKVHDETKKLIKQLYSQGWSLRAVARAVNLSMYAVRKVLINEGVLIPAKHSCPRCGHKLRWDDIEGAYKCRSCGYKTTS